MANQIDIITTSLEALIQRATNPTNQGPDSAAIDAFCGLVNREPECSQIAAKLITAKVHSLQEWEALQALLVLETCMKRCSTHFLCEVGKFRFLNELIKLVSPKYLGAHTPEFVRRRVLELMHSWTLSYPKEVKIKEAYDMLKKQGVVKSDPVPTPPREPAPLKRDPTSILQDEEKSQLLQKLLQSKNPQDLQAANRLIKTMVKEEERRNEEKWRNHMELETVVNNCRLLSEMLDSYQEGITSDQELELIRELHNTCQNLRPALFKLANTNADPGFCHEVLTVNDELGEVFARYSSLVKSPPTGLPNSSSQLLQPKPDQPSSSLLDLSPSPDQPTSSSKDLADLGVNFLATGASNGASPHTSSTDILRDVFVDNILPASQPQAQPIIQDPFAINNLISQQQRSVSPSVINNQPPDNTIPKNKGLEELDLLSKMLMEQSLSTASGLNSTKKTIKDDASNESNPPPSDVQSLDDDFLLNLSSWPSDKNDGSNPGNVDSSGLLVDSLDVLSPAPSEPVSNLSTPLHSKKDQTQEEKPVQPLGDINVTLDSIRPSSAAPFQGLDDKNGITTVIHLAKDRPRPDVSVYVITTSSKSQSALTNFLFQPIVPKYCRLRLLPASGSALPPHNPFLPPSAITQVMLIASPKKDPIPLKFVISFTMDEETITEMGEVDRLLLTDS